MSIRFKLFNILDKKWCGWLHAACEGLTPADHSILELAQNYSCVRCQNISKAELKLKILNVMEELHSNLTSCSEKIDKLKLELVQNEEMMISDSGAIVSSIYKAMKEKQIRPESYYGNIYTSTTSMKWMENHETFTDFIPDTEVRNKWNLIFSTYHRICKKILSAKQIKDEERPQLYADLELFGHIWVSYIDKNVIPKMDTLIMVVPKLIEALDGHCGSLSEQNIERIHNNTNQEARRCFNIVEAGQRAEYLLKVIF